MRWEVLRGITHLLFALATSSVVSWIADYPFYLIIFAGIGALIPDIDEPRSMIGRFVGIFHLVMKHRGFFHSLLFASLFGIFMYILDPKFGIFYSIGVLSHLLLDTMTKSGIALFYPLSYRIKGPFKTGGIFDWILLLVSMMVLLGIALLML